MFLNGNISPSKHKQAYFKNIHLFKILEPNNFEKRKQQVVSRSHMIVFTRHMVNGLSNSASSNETEQTQDRTYDFDEIIEEM